jgi:phenylalanyl-tRNA synthetase beta chain
VASINRLLGTALPAVQVAECLSRMALAGQLTASGEAVKVSVPPTRSDVLHACDVAEVRRKAQCAYGIVPWL